jgi:hypothetical protein
VPVVEKSHARAGEDADGEGDEQPPPERQPERAKHRSPFARPSAGRRVVQGHQRSPDGRMASVSTIDILRNVLSGCKRILMRAPHDAPMTTNTALILNGILAVGLLAALGYVMYLGHGIAGSRTRRAAYRPAPIERGRVERSAATGDFKRAA